jgi:hypothetical protein
LKNGEKLLINKVSRKIDRFDYEEWGVIIKKQQQNDWIIISEK